MSLSHSIKMLEKFDFLKLSTGVLITTLQRYFRRIRANLYLNSSTQLIGSLLYVSNRTRLDIPYTVSRLSRFTHNHSRAHWTVLERVLRYLRDTLDFKLIFSGYTDVIEGYINANWVRDYSIKSTLGFVFLRGGATVSWRSCKQTVIARSTMDVELIALDTTYSEAEWLKNLISELPILSEPIPAIFMHTDSRTTIELLKQDIINRKLNKYLHIRFRA